MKTALKIILISTFSICLIVLIALSYLFISVKDYKLDQTKLTTVMKKIEYYDDNDSLIKEETNGGKNSYISIDKLSSDTINAFIAIEDRKFFKHDGVDYKRILGATLKNVKSMSFKEGASTISQQLIKNTHLNSEKTLKRKVAEFKITKELEKKYDKYQILEKYLNTIYFGKNAYGINEASNLYFNKTADKLNLSESAMLAGLIKSPNYYSPLYSYENANKRKNTVLKAMLDCGYISKNDYISSKEEVVSISQGVKTNYFDDYISAVKLEIENIISENPYNNETIKVYTYLNANVQKEIREIELVEVANVDEIKIVKNNKNSGIIAFCGKNSIFSRCPASTVKPWLIYAPMIEENFITESSIINDSPINFSGYSPKNYGGKCYGNVTVKDALKNSLNIPCVKLLDGFTIKKVNKYANKLGINITNEGLSCALGSINGGMTLKEICDAYSPFNNDGNYLKSSFIRKVIVNGKEVFNNKPIPMQVFSKETAYIVNDMLIDGVKSGTSKKLKDLNYQVCAKTGTNGDNNGNLDAYSISYTTEHTIGVWLGKENGDKMDLSVTGGGYPTLINREILNLLYKNHKPNDFDIPCGVTAIKLNREKLVDNMEYVYDKNGENFYYINGSIPKIQTTTSDFKLETPTILLQNGNVTIKINAENCKTLKIYRKYRNQKITVYSGDYVSEFFDTLNDYGVYEYSLIFIDTMGKNHEFILNSINYSKNNLKITNEDWWDM
ncbi:MAG: transglycosylase domain-containing protein [Clostridia bacterium]|nr:transglycosylase domain-containing protein [Clostridia bacterium]